MTVGQLYALDFPNGKRYIGVTTKTADARFKTHEKALRMAKPNCAAVYSAWRKHGAPTLTVLAIVEDADLFETEKRAIAVFGTLSPGGYNLTVGGESSPAKHPEVRAKIGAALRNPSDATRAKLSAARRNLSDEARAKISAAKRNPTAETRAKLAAAATGRKMSTEAIAKTAAAHRGKTVTPATRAKLSAALRGKKLSPEHKNKLSAARKTNAAMRKTEMQK